MMKEKGFSKNNCMICGEELEYYAVPRELECTVCHGKFQAEAACVNGHFICDGCHAKEGIDLILEVCSGSDSRNPVEIMKGLMEHPCIHMHGPEHHVLAGAALLTAYSNCKGKTELLKALQEMARRGQQVPGGTCGFWGCCGAAVSTGIFVSIITGADPLKEREWGLSNLMTSASLKAIGGIGGPRCCKRDTFLAVAEAVYFVKEHLGVEMELPEAIQCTFSPLNSQCIGERCPFNEKHGTAV